MGGQIGVNSEPGLGSEFWFTFRAGIAREPAGVQTELQGRLVLVVDHHAGNRRVLQSQLERHGCGVQAVASGAEALDRIALALPLAAVVIDMHMPEIDGLALAAGIRSHENAHRLPVVLLASHTERDRTGSVVAGVVLVKPVRESQLVARLVSLLSAPAPVPSQPRPQAPARTPLSGTILLAEDNPVNQRVASLLLRKLGFEAKVVSNGREAVAAVRAARFDLILMDCQMPEMDGFEATRAIRADRPEDGPVIIALTANVLAGERDRCMAAGMDDYLGKPIRTDLLKEKLEHWMSVCRERHPA
jgi:two-component system sensor histidine kinase/response regulator